MHIVQVITTLQAYVANISKDTVRAVFFYRSGELGPSSEKSETNLHRDRNIHICNLAMNLPFAIIRTSQLQPVLW